MDKEVLKQMSYDEVRALYRTFLEGQEMSPNSTRTAYSDTFYIWRKCGQELFWATVEGDDNNARTILFTALTQHSSGDAKKLVNAYLSQIHRFRLFLESDRKTGNESAPKVQPNPTPMKPAIKNDVVVPIPTTEQVEMYLAKWDNLESYHLQEEALDKLFFSLCPNNDDISDILLKVSTLNDFYSTHIFSVYPVAKRIHSLRIDARLKAGDVTLVNDIKHITINGVERNMYSFASKYCSHHNPKDYPIYDSYVDTVLRFYRNRDGFAVFENDDLKDYVLFKGALIDFRAYYGLQAYDLKQIDKYLWQLGKDYFPKSYGKKKNDTGLDK